MSCDSYSDIWKSFAIAFDKFWPDCPFEIFLVSEEKDFIHPTIKNIKVGYKVTWSKMLHYVIDKIQAPYLIYLQEDYLLRNYVENQKLERLLKIFEETNAAYLRLFPWPGPDSPHDYYQEVGILYENSNYRTSLQAAIWDAQVLKSICDIDDGAHFEKLSIERAKNISRPFLCVNRNNPAKQINYDGHYPIDYFATSVFQGKWQKEALKIYRKIGIPIDTSRRGVMNRIDFLEYHYRKKHANTLFYKLLRLTKTCLDFLNQLFIKKAT